MKRIGVIWVCIILMLSSAFTLIDMREEAEGKPTDTITLDTNPIYEINKGTNPDPQPTWLDYYTDRAAFDIDAPGLPTEDFTESSPDPPAVPWEGPINNQTDNGFYRPGDLIDGFSIDCIPDPDRMVVLTKGFLGVESTCVGPNTFADDTNITFPTDNVTAVGMELLCPLGAETVDIEIFGLDGVSLGTTTHLTGTTAGTFWGVISDDIITKIIIVGPGYTGEMVDNLVFGEVVPILPTYNLTLSEGWNLVSFPLIQVSNALDGILETIDGKWDYILAWDSLDPDHWKTNCIYRPDQLNDLNMLNRKMGFWINITEPNVILTVTGHIPTITTTTLYSGWSLVGYPSLTEKPVSEVLAGTGYDAVEGFNATAPYRLSPLDDTYMMKPGEAYWVHVPVNTVWVVDW